MRIKKTRFSTMLSDLYGRDNYQAHLTVGREFWWNFPEDSDVGRATGRSWNKLRITYRRSGCIFYQILDANNIGEQFCPVNCFMASSFIFADLDPIEDLPFIKEEGIEKCQQMYCFDDTRTVIHNWDNSSECDIDEEQFMKDNPSDYIIIMSQDINKLKKGST